MYKHILIATDGSPQSEDCIRHGINLARIHSSRVTLITVTTPYSVSGFASGYFDTPSNIDEYTDYWDKIATKILSSADQYAEECGVKLEKVHAVEVSPSTAITEEADKHDCDLIIMGSHGKRSIKRVLLGSQVNEVLHTTTRPVLVIR